MRIDVFTLVPHAFAWLTEQRPLAAVLGTELELRLLNYRDTSPLKSGQVDDEPYGGGAGMVLRVDVVAAALDAVARRLPGALGSPESGLEESFSAELEGGLEYPHFTRPAEFRGWQVPEVLLSVDHARIEEWRREQSRARSVR